MGYSGQISALEARDRKQYPVEVTNIPKRGAGPAKDGQRFVSFPEVVANTSTRRDLQSTMPEVSGKPKPFTLWEKQAFAFSDFIDIVNPLQHIPIVATIYRHRTDDKIGFAPRVIGGALWGRLGGLIGGAINAVVDWVTGKDIGDHVYAALFGKTAKSPPAIGVVQTAGSVSAASLRAGAVLHPPGAGMQLSSLSQDTNTGRSSFEISKAAEERPSVPTMAAGPAQAVLNAYESEKRWDVGHCDDRRIRCTV